MGDRGRRSRPTRILCVNCSICVNTLRRYQVLTLNPRAAGVLCSWVYPQIISEENYTCEACRDLTMSAVNDNLQQVSDNAPPGSSQQGHTSVCLISGCSTLRRRSDRILRDDTSELLQSMIAIIESRVPRQVTETDRLCHTCWTRVQREARCRRTVDDARNQPNILQTQQDEPQASQSPPHEEPQVSPPAPQKEPVTSNDSITLPDYSIFQVDAKGAIYLSTKNGTFPITLTSLKSRDDATSQHTQNILSATAKNLSHGASRREQDYWDDSEMLLSNYINVTYDEVDAYSFKQNIKRSINDAVSKNITSVLENLLKNYENSQLPTHGKGYPTVVQTNILIRSMGPVSELDMDYSMDCYFRQYWRDTRLSFHGPIRSLSLSIKMLERIWRPDTYFYNGKHSYVHTITVPNKLLRISQHGDILYSMRLTIKAKCPMELRNFPMDRQSCPLILGSYAYSNQQLVYQWQNSQSVNFVPGMTLSQFDLISFPYRNFTFARREGEFSVLQVSFNLQRHTGYFLIQVYVPCILIVVLSWVSFWIHREATSDRVGLGITTVLTLSTISLDSRTDLPKVRYATALDWFLLMSFFYCIATLLEFAGVHYFTKVGSGEIVIDDSEWEELIEEVGGDAFAARQLAVRRRSSARSVTNFSFTLPAQSNLEDSDRSPKQSAVRLTMERTTQTERRVPRWRQLLYCLAGDDRYRRQRQVEAGSRSHINSVSHIDRAARVLFPASFAVLNLFYWMVYALSNDDFAWSDNPMNTLSH